MGKRVSMLSKSSRSSACIWKARRMSCVRRERTEGCYGWECGEKVGRGRVEWKGEKEGEERRGEEGEEKRGKERKGRKGRRGEGRKEKERMARDDACVSAKAMEGKEGKGDGAPSLKIKGSLRSANQIGGNETGASVYLCYFVREHIAIIVVCCHTKASVSPTYNLHRCSIGN